MESQGTQKLETLSMPDCQRVHEEATIVDLHAHPTLKASMFPFSILFGLANRRKRPDKQPRPILYTIFNPFKIRTSFPLLQMGRADVMLTATVVSEEEMFQSIPFFRVLNLIARLLPIHAIRKSMSKSYFKQTIQQLRRIEAAVNRYNRFVERYNRRIPPRGSQDRERRRYVRVANSPQALKDILDGSAEPPIVLVHAIEGGHSLHGKQAGKRVAEFIQFHRKSLKFERLADPSADPEYNDYLAMCRELEAELKDNLHQFRELGVACITVAHFYPNVICAPAYPYPAYAELLLGILGARIGRMRYAHDISLGLTPVGREIIREIFNLGMLVDVTHCTPASRAGIYRLVEDEDIGHGQVVATHVGAYGINPSPYNLDDWEIRWIAEHEGVVGVILMEYWLQPHDRAQGLNYLSRTIEHVIKAGNTRRDGTWDDQEPGYDVVALGTDLDGFTDPTDAIPHFGLLSELTERLLGEYWSPRDLKYRTHPPDLIEKILGGNAERVLRNGWR